ncbi:MAG: response regulator transcription factor [Kiritimatiellae bacterium]|nr:response regulator transcription factor [Kiritimatiellia bacterium]
MIRVAIIDDHFVVRVGLRSIVEMQSDMAFVGEAASAANIVSFFDRVKCDVLFLDIRMPGKDGLDALDELLAARPAAKVIMLTTSEADNDVYESLSSGAKGYLLKDRDSLAIVDAVHRVAAGGTFIPDAVKDLYKQRQMTPNPTKREKEVLELVVKGLTNEQIAKTLDISYKAAKFHVGNLFMKLDVADRTKLVAVAIRRGFVKNLEETVLVNAQIDD